jgi:hypothetical protein
VRVGAAQRYAVHGTPRCSSVKLLSFARDALACTRHCPHTPRGRLPPNTATSPCPVLRLFAEQHNASSLALGGFAHPPRRSHQAPTHTLACLHLTSKRRVSSSRTLPLTLTRVVRPCMLERCILARRSLSTTTLVVCHVTPSEIYPKSPTLPSTAPPLTSVHRGPLSPAHATCLHSFVSPLATSPPQPPPTPRSSR